METEVSNSSYDDEVGVTLSDRLVVSCHAVPPTDACLGKWVFLARLRYEDRPEVVAHATFCPRINFLEWFEVNTRFRRQGIGREFYQAIERHLAEPFKTCAGSEDGEAFCKALGLDD